MTNQYIVKMLSPKHVFDETSNKGVENKYLTVKTENEDFKNLLDIITPNIRYYFSACLNVKDKVTQYLKETNKKFADVRIYHAPDKDDCTEYTDVKNKNSTVYMDFIENLVKKAHARSNLTFVEYIKDNHKKADVIFSHFFDNAKISVTYFTKPIMMCINFDKNGLNIVYMLNSCDSNKMMLDITINHNTEIISTEVYFNFNNARSDETDMITLNHQQLDYLIVLSHYADGEEIDFITEKYVDDILAENYEDFINYIKLKEMIYI
jgi:hypothetical protein